MKQYYIYIMANERPTLYVGVTNDLVRRAYQHKNDLVGGFTKEYQLHKLVYFEQTEDVNSAISREKQLKRYLRQWKIDLIKKTNPKFEDLYDSILGSSPRMTTTQTSLSGLTGESGNKHVN